MVAQPYPPRRRSKGNPGPRDSTLLYTHAGLINIRKWLVPGAIPWAFSFTRQGKSSSHFVRSEHWQTVEEQLRNYKRLRELVET